jgi:hypothetical protein
LFWEKKRKKKTRHCNKSCIYICHKRTDPSQPFNKITIQQIVTYIFPVQNKIIKCDHKQSAFLYSAQTCGPHHTKWNVSINKVSSKDSPVFKRNHIDEDKEELNMCMLLITNVKSVPFYGCETWKITHINSNCIPYTSNFCK